MLIERQLPKRVLSVFLALLMIFTLIPINVIGVNAAENEKAHIKIGTTTAMPGETVELNVVLEDAPTIKSMSILDITYDTSKMTLSNVEWLCDAEIRNWNSSQGRGVLAFGENTDANGSILKMSFAINKIADDANVSISCNMTLKRMDNTDNEIVVDSEIISGNITIQNAIRGDMDNNGKLNSNDAVYLLYHVMFGKNDYPIHQSGDMDGNDKVNSNDAVYLLYHIMFGEEDYPIHLPCAHSMQHFVSNAATCTKDGNMEYWYCALCNNYFGDADGKEMFAYDHTIIPATGHTVVIDSSSSFGGSSTNSTSKTTSKIVSEKVAQTYGYGKSYSSGGASSESQGLQSTQSENNEYGSAVTYSTETAQTVSDTYTTMGTKPGYHRWVMVGKAHVFAIVGYDMTTDSFFTYTYSVMDDTEPLQQFEDYSYTTGSYNDAENGVIPFEVPYEVAEYVSERTCYSAGLKIDQSTGIITGYTGTDDYVVIPEYMNVGGGDVVKVTGISSTAFKGNTYIKEVRLSDFITEIPNNAFENCTSLFGISGGNITSIGNNAFYNCIEV